MREVYMIKDSFFSIRLTPEDKNRLKSDAKKNKEKPSAYARKKIFDNFQQAPNLMAGNWWDSPEVLRKIAREVKKEMKK